MKFTDLMFRKKKLIWKLSITLSFSIFCVNSYAQHSIQGKVVNSYDKTPIEGAVITILNSTHTTKTKGDGTFSLDKIIEEAPVIRVWSPGFFESRIELLGRSQIEITLVSEGREHYENVVSGSFSSANSRILTANDYPKGATTVEQVLTGQIAGLRVTNKSGMPSEGGALNFRGIRSFEANNNPLIVVDEVPFFPDMDNSPIIGGYSLSIFAPFNLQDIKSIRFLKGAETARYGSLGSNGVLKLETSASDDMETVIEYHGNFGISHQFRRLPLLNDSQYKSYLGAVGMTNYNDMGELLTQFPFLKDDPNYYYNYLYNNKTDWQDQIYRNAFVTDHHLRIKGGDAIAKYDLSLGVLNQQGALDYTSNTRYSTRLNSTIALGQKFDLNAMMALTYSTGRLQEQGMLKTTNPMLAAMYRAPILSPYTKDKDNNVLNDLDGVRQFGVSNPIALLQTGDFTSDIYDVFAQANLRYSATKSLQFNALLGFYTNYSRQTTFVPGLSSGTIVPLENGMALNTARSGAGKSSNISWNFYGSYSKQYGKDQWEAGAGVQGLLNSQEYDAGAGRNTSSDFYRTLNYVSNAGRKFWGYDEDWNWMNMYGFLNYNWRSLLKLDVNLSVDGTSVTGSNVGRFGFFPAADLSILLSNMSFLKERESLNKLILKFGYAKTGNSRFSSKIGQSYYSSQLYRQLAGIVVGNIPNNKIRWEDNQNLQGNLIFSGFNQRLNVNAGYYYNRASHLLNAFSVSPIAGIDKIFLNGGQIDNHGLEVDVNFAFVDKKDWSFTLGGNLSTLNSTVKKLLSVDPILLQQEDDVVRIHQVGQSPFSFYGYQSNGVIASAKEAEQLNLYDYKNRMFSAGDIQFEDINNDGIIDAEDRMDLGNSLPKLFGGAYFSFRYKKFQLQGLMSFTKGNKAYNAVRRSLEDLSSYNNQSIAALRRWQTDGQQTDVPQAQYGDPMENARFSNRWIEDASYMRLENLSLSYRFGNHRLKILSNSEWYITAENLFTWSKYLGLDPVTAYSNNMSYTGADYGKIPLPRTFKLGVNIKL
ncbi:SusC/RagA family TonB-linked outer membrane protein [Sphingobacterium sp. DR205]|uniref:SusC/RagA family TonB-linked outer membrane protein n=1 Tax=Sphingobacterium sp. DR205 TaxID=2713573 RepID=UPI001F49491C|nr:SusC/RagA family TonB-linked outer membrane protein [Sphingobacterium sp. DR205]